MRTRPQATAPQGGGAGGYSLILISTLEYRDHTMGGEGGGSPPGRDHTYTYPWEPAGYLDCKDCKAIVCGVPPFSRRWRLC